ncbi:MAG: serine/threonine-protein kinase [Pirellulales bacterium]
MTLRFEQLGPYRIGKVLGRGGMGTVYEGTDAETGQRAAIKVLTPQLAVAEGFRERFEAEIDSLKKLRHPHIVRLYGYGEQEGYLFYAMELVEGSSLEEEIRSGRRFNWREATTIGIQVCKALKHAHDHGVIHRDIKPANLLYDSDGNIKLSDFGIARLFGGVQLTSAGGVLGTAEYMSPEQADGRTVTTRCDQYSLGGVMYTLLAGRPPFRAKTMPELLQLQRFAEPEPVRRFAPDAPVELERIVMQLLEKEPEKRFPNAQILSRHMEAMIKGLTRPITLHDSGEGEPKMPVAEGGSAAAVHLAETRVSPSNAGIDHFEVDDLELEPLDRSSARTTFRESKEVSRAAAAAESSDASPAVSFTTVEEEARRRSAAEPEVSPLVRYLQLAALAASLIGLAALLWYMLQPPSADALYADIQEVAKDDQAESLSAAEPAIRDFLTRYPNDPRAEELVAYRDAIDLERIERRLRVRGLRPTDDNDLGPIERIYVEAIDSAESQPQQAVEKLGAMLALYDGDSEQLSRRERLGLELARRKRDQLQARIDETANLHRDLITQHMTQAESVRQSDPARARQLLDAIVTLYGEKPWASEQVDRARRMLAELGTP